MFGVGVLRFDWLFREIAARAGHAERGRLRRPARADRRGGRAPRAARACSPSRPPSRASCAPRARFVAELGRSMVGAGPRSRRRCAHWAGDGPRRALRGGGRGDLPRLPRRARGRRAGRRRSCSPGSALDALRRASRDALARHAGVRLRLRRLRRRSSSTRSRRWPTAAAPTWSSRSRTSPGGSAFKAVASIHQELLARGADELELPPLDDHYAAESRDGAAPPGAQPVRGRGATGRRPRPRAPSPSTQPAASAPRSSLPARGCSSCCATASTPGDVAVVLRDPSPTRRCSSRCSAPTGSRSRSTAGCRFGHTGLGRGLLALIRAAAAGRHGRRPARVPAHARAAARAGPRRPPRGGGAARGRPRAPPTRASAGSATAGSSTTSTGSRDARDTATFVAELERPARRACSRRPTSGPRPSCSGPELDEARAFSAAQRALAELRAVLGRPRTRLDPQHVLARAGAAEVHARRDPPARPRAGGHAGGDPRAPLRGRCSSAGSRRASSRAARRRSRSCPTTTGARSRRPAGSSCRCARTASTASATSSTSAPRAPSGCWC